MIITQRKMCRESRKVFEFLDDLASKNGVQGIITPAHIYMCDVLVCQFFTEPIKNVIKNKLQHLGKKTSNHFEVTYWSPIITMMLSDKAARRGPSITSLNLESFDYINDLMITDYSIEDTIKIHNIIATYSTAQIRNACNVARSMGVYNIQYVGAVLERAMAEHQITVKKIDNISFEISKSDKLLTQNVNQHSAIDIALAQYNFQKKLEDYELERKMNELAGGI